MFKEKLLIPIDSEAERFREHLAEPDNERIIFSGKFGSGKTYFLKDFFTQEDNSYEWILVSPISYSTGKNDDIFEYLKYDILYHLIDYGLVDINDKNIQKSMVWESFAAKDGLDGGSEILEMLKKVSFWAHNGGEIFSFLSKEKELKRNITNDPDNLVCNNFIKNYSKHHFEFDAICSIIYHSIKAIDKSKQKVLIIDDLDRIDPAHIFRIINVFTSHLDNPSGGNRFGFDKIILACDIYNLRSIFAHIYGGDTDFNGYIDKFYSKSIFEFDNMSAIRDSLHMLSVLQHKSEVMSGEYELLNILLRRMVYIKAINLRTLLKKLNKLSSVYKKTFVHKENDTTLSCKDSSIVHVFIVLLELFGSKHALVDTLEKCDEEYPDLSLTNYHTDTFLAEMIHARLLPFEYIKMDNTHYEAIDHENNLRILYDKIERKSGEGGLYEFNQYYISRIDKDDERVKRIALYKYLLMAFKTFKKNYKLKN